MPKIDSKKAKTPKKATAPKKMLPSHGLETPKEKEQCGVKPWFKTPEEMQIKIDEYFSNPPVEVKYTSEGEKYHAEAPTITGLAYHLGFSSRQSLYDYELKPLFAYTIKRARLKMEIYYEQKLMFGATTGSIFALKKGWSECSKT